MLRLHSFFRWVMGFIRSCSLKVKQERYPFSSILMTGMMVIAILACSANGLGGSGRNALAAPISEEGQLLAGSLLQEEIRKEQKQKEEAQVEIQVLQRQIVKEKEEEAARRRVEERKRREEEERRAARRISYTDEDYQVLLRIVQAEAGICDEKGKILVANVIINRVLSEKFPDSVRAVVYAPSQFQPVSNGSINSVRVTEETIECVERALEGEDYSKGALYFMNRKGSGNAASWFDKHLDYLFSHDGHEFFR